MKKLIVIDGNSLLFRAYYATAFNGEIMHTKDGFPTNAIFGFNNMIMKLVSSLKEGDLFFVSFDTGHKTFRHEEMETYKAQRKPVDEALIKQFKPAREYLDALNAFHYELDGYEGDDLAGTVAKMGSRENLDVEIYTSDKDYLQLIDDHIAIQMIRKGLKDIVRYDAATLKETMGLEPDQIRDYKGLMGDPSDNIKGIPGIGEKTASNIAAWFADGENRAELSRFAEAGVKPFVKQIVSGGPIMGQNVVLTGTLSQFKRSEAQKLIEEAGGVCQSAVTQKTTLVIAGEAAGSKLEKAQALGVKIIDEAEFIKILSENGIALK